VRKTRKKSRRVGKILHFFGTRRAGRRVTSRGAMIHTMNRAAVLFAVLTLASVWHADAACASSQTFAKLQPSVRVGKRTRAKRRHDTQILEETTTSWGARSARTLFLSRADPPHQSTLVLPKTQQTGLGTDPYEVEWITTQSGKVRRGFDENKTLVFTSSFASRVPRF
jgi:hypothetical protein